MQSKIQKPSSPDHLVHTIEKIISLAEELPGHVAAQILENTRQQALYYGMKHLQSLGPTAVRERNLDSKAPSIVQKFRVFRAERLVEKAKKSGAANHLAALISQISQSAMIRRKSEICIFNPKDKLCDVARVLGFDRALKQEASGMLMLAKGEEIAITDEDFKNLSLNDLLGREYFSDPKDDNGYRDEGDYTYITLVKSPNVVTYCLKAKYSESCQLKIALQVSE